MQQPVAFPVIAVDVGNSRIKLGLFERSASATFPQPTRSLALEPDFRPQEILGWLPGQPTAYAWLVASVARSSAARLFAWLSGLPAGDTVGIDARLLSVADLPLAVAVEQPERVGMDRLVAAVAVNRLRDPRRAAIVIDLGSALTVDLVGSDGRFLGGAILPGIGMSARALHEFTDLLPLLAMAELAEPPPALGTATLAAMRSGLYWGAVGAMRELVSQLGQGQPSPQLFLTGGAAPTVAELLRDAQGEPAQYLPHLTLSGIALAAGG